MRKDHQNVDQLLFCADRCILWDFVLRNSFAIWYFVIRNNSAVCSKFEFTKNREQKGKDECRKGGRKIGLGKGRLSSFPFPLFASVSWQVLLQMAEV